MINTSLEKTAVTNGTEVVCLHEYFEAQCDIRPYATAVRCGDVSLSYSELETKANQLAHMLRDRGTGPGSLVGLSYDRSELPIIAILGCLKAGAAYVPLDPGHPDDRIKYIVEEAAIEVILTEAGLADRFEPLVQSLVIAIDRDAAVIATCSDRRLSREDSGVTASDLCYVLFTSGTTGRPKGVMTEHRNAVHFVPAFNTVCTTTSEDVVYQGFSLGFDGSVEEIWMAFSNGASLLVGTPMAPRFGNELAQYLSRMGVTYFSTVPTMLSTMTEDIPCLRQIVVSGEVCSTDLVAKWAKPGRLMLNVYGPTEATVNTTAFECLPGRPVTIGRPLPGYESQILDANLQPVPLGEMGELFVGGRGIARGYLNQPDLTSKQFFRCPDTGRRLYRTGDLARINQDGEIEFFGRIDSQVKIRGYRVELAEIEAVLCENPAIMSAVVKLHKQDSVASLAAYVVLDPMAEFDRDALTSALRSRLPAYMVPSWLDVMTELPRLASGKINRRELSPPSTPLVDETEVGEQPAGDLEKSIADAWAAAFGFNQVGAEQDFFKDLGGHSLLAAQAVTLLRERAALRVPVRDVYAYPTVRKLAHHLSTGTAPEPGATISKYVVPPAIRPKPGVRTTLIQAMAIMLLLVIFSLPSAVVIPVIDLLVRAELPIVSGIIFFVLLALGLWPLLLLIGICSKWVIIGRYRPGAYPLWSSYYLRWWLVQRLQGASFFGLLNGTPLMSVYYRLMGAKVGRHCAIQTNLCSIWDGVRIGEDTAIGPDTQLLGYRIENGYLLLGGIEIGSRCFVGAHSALGLDIRMGDESRLDDQSLLPDGAVLDVGEHRRGSPAQPASVGVPGGPRRAVEDISRRRHAFVDHPDIVRYSILRLVLFCVGAYIFGTLLAVIFGLPALGLALFWVIAARDGFFVLAIGISFLASPLLLFLSCLLVALLKAIVLRRARPGVHELYSFYYLRHWMSEALMRSIRTTFLPIFTTIYLPPWMRLLGARVGRHAEMSTVFALTPELLTIGDGSFFADGSMIGGRRTYGGRFEVQSNSIGNRSFVGNSAMLPVGSSLRDNSLLGVLSVPPSRTEPTPDSTDWLGSPPFNLPNRQKVGSFNDTETYQPSRKLYAQRALVDACRIFIPTYTGMILGLAGLVTIFLTYRAYGLLIMLAVAPVLALGLAAAAVLVVVCLKWVVMGRFKPVIVPLWSPYVWFNEMLNGAYESIMAPVVAQFFGTPFAAPLLRLLGCRIGRNCYIGSSLFSEFDLIDIGDYAALNAGAIIQNHLFEDRIMKSSYLKVGAGCTVGNMAVVLYDTVMEDNAVVGPLSLLMKGETMPSGSRWHGIPTVQG